MFKPRFVTLLIIPLFVIVGCSKLSPPPVQTLSEAEKKFNQICQEEYNFTPVVFRLTNTVWIYIPLEQNIFEFKVSDKGPSSSTQASKSFAINYLEGQFANGQFMIQYDIGAVKKYAKDPGYSTSYTEEFQKKQRGILTAVFRAYAELPTDKRSPDMAPDFFVLVIADIKTGLETKTIFYFPDFKRAMTDQFFYEEFTRRTVSDDPIGQNHIIDDRNGAHLNPTEITLPEFLAKQIVFRIRYKFQRSDFPPDGDIREEITKIISETLANYNFRDSESIELEDLTTGEKKIIEKQNLK